MENIKCIVLFCWTEERNSCDHEVRIVSQKILLVPHSLNQINAIINSDKRFLIVDVRVAFIKVCIVADYYFYQIRYLKKIKYKNIKNLPLFIFVT